MNLNGDNRENPTLEVYTNQDEMAVVGRLCILLGYYLLFIERKDTFFIKHFICHAFLKIELLTSLPKQNIKLNKATREMFRENCCSFLADMEMPTRNEMRLEDKKYVGSETCHTNLHR